MKKINIDKKVRIVLILILIIAAGSLLYFAYINSNYYREKQYKIEDRDIKELKEKYNIEKRNYVKSINVNIDK